MSRLWWNIKPFVYFAAFIAFQYFVLIKQVIPVWMGVIIFCAPTVVFVITAVIALVDPFWLVSVRESQTGPRVGQRKRA